MGVRYIGSSDTHIYILMNYKETDTLRNMRIQGTNNGLTLKTRVVKSKKIYKRNKVFYKGGPNKALLRERHRPEKLFTDVRGMTVPDLGCGRHRKYSSDRGAASFPGNDALGIDDSIHA